MTLPYSGAIFIQAFPRECTETFLEGHRRAFEFFGGVPRRISYDNSAIAVIEVLQGPRAEADQGVPAAAEPLSVPGTLLPGAAAQREGARRATDRLRPPELPGPRAAGRFAGGAERAAAGALPADLAERTRGKPARKSELLAEDQAAFLPLPKQPFEARRVDRSARPIRSRWSASTTTTTRCRCSTPIAS